MITPKLDWGHQFSFFYKLHKSISMHPLQQGFYILIEPQLHFPISCFCFSLIILLQERVRDKHITMNMTSQCFEWSLVWESGNQEVVPWNCQSQVKSSEYNAYLNKCDLPPIEDNFNLGSTLSRWLQPLYLWTQKACLQTLQACGTIATLLLKGAD